MEINKVTQIAKKYQNKLSNFCSRIEIAGSIRRQRQEVKDIELVCIPKMTFEPDGMFDKKEIRDSGFVTVVNSFPRVKGNGEGKYAQIILPEEIHLDLFMTTPEQWGIIFMIRTGSAFFVKRMVTEIKKSGFKCDEGFLKTEEGKIIPCYEEKEFFEITGMEYVEPFMRVF